MQLQAQRVFFDLKNCGKSSVRVLNLTGEDGPGRHDIQRVVKTRADIRPISAGDRMAACVEPRGYPIDNTLLAY